MTKRTRLKTTVLITATLKVDDRVELLSEPKWLQDWDPIYPELNLKSD